MRMILLGPPGAGKGTQARHLVERFGLDHIATGDIFRWNIKEGTPLGKLAKGYLDSGELVPDDVTTQIVMDAIDRAGDGFVLDGFPRTLGQAEALDAELAKRGAELTAVLAFLIDEDVALRRVAGRRTCANCHRTFNVFSNPPAEEGVCEACGGPLVQRTDEDEATLRHRLDVYRDSTTPLLEYYSDRGLLREIDADGTEAAVTERALEALVDPLPEGRP